MSEAATRLGTSVPRVRRAITRRGIVTTSTPRGSGRPPRVLDEAQFHRLRDELGAEPSHGRRRREELRVLAAFNMNPFGYRSRRAVASAAGISPTTAGTIVDHLLDEGLVVAVRRLTRNAGRVVDGVILEANREDEKWSAVLDDVLATHLPVPQTSGEAKIVPRRYWHLFWNASPARLRVIEDADFIAARMLLSNDPLALSWAATHLPVSSIEKTATLRQVNDRDARWLRGLARARRESVEA